MWGTAGESSLEKLSEVQVRAECSTSSLVQAYQVPNTAHAIFLPFNASAKNDYIMHMHYESPIEESTHSSHAPGLIAAVEKMTVKKQKCIFWQMQHKSAVITECRHHSMIEGITLLAEQMKQKAKALALDVS